jgi:hypothetical protein
LNPQKAVNDVFPSQEQPAHINTHDSIVLLNEAIDDSLSGCQLAFQHEPVLKPNPFVFVLWTLAIAVSHKPCRFEVRFKLGAPRVSDQSPINVGFN